MATILPTTFPNASSCVENCCILIKILQKFVPRDAINKKPSLIRIMAWCRSRDKPLSEPMMAYYYWRIYIYMHHPAQSSPSDAYMRQWIWSALVQIMARRLIGTKPLTKPMLGYCPLRTNFSEIFFQIKQFSFTKMNIKIVCEMTAILFSGRRVKCRCRIYKRPELIHRCVCWWPSTRWC